MTKTTILYDGDMGGDDLWAIAMLLAHPDRFDIAGISTVFGNVPVTTATRNVLNFLHWLKTKPIPIVQGAANPYDGMQAMIDDAYGSDGVGGVILPESPQKPDTQDIVQWYNTQLHAHPDCTIICTGPATNIAQFLTKYPKKAVNIQEIILMCGALRPLGKDFKPVMLENGQIRKGNITDYAEFNAYQDPLALNIILRSGAKCAFMSADATQYMVLNPARQQRVMSIHPTYGPAFHRMLMAVEELDRSKFGVDGPFIHDPNVATYMLQPDLYKGRSIPTLYFEELPPEDPHRGETVVTGQQDANVHWLDHVTDSEAVFELMLKSLKEIIGKAS